MRVGTHYLQFVVAAGASVPFNLGARVLFSNFVPFEIAVAGSHVVGMIVAFTLTRLFVFGRSQRRISSEFGRFVLVNIGSLCVTWVVSSTLLRLIFPMIGVAVSGYSEFAAHVAGLGIASVTSFFGHRDFSFRRDRV
jgi:putative flippase GtrA